MNVFRAAFPELLFEHYSLLGYQENASLIEYWRGIEVIIRLDEGF